MLQQQQLLLPTQQLLLQLRPQVIILSLQHERRVGTDGVSLGGGANSINNNPINNNNISSGKEGLVFKDTAVLNNKVVINSAPINITVNE